MAAESPEAGTVEFGMIGLGVMGENLSMNVERNGFSVAVYNRELDWTDKFINGAGKGKKIVGTKSFEEFAKSLKRPRRMMMMIKAGQPVDWTIDQIKPFLEPGDIIIDGGNSWFEDTVRREAALTAEGFHFIGSGVSGGEEGALWGPSLMPGGKREAYEEIRPIFEAIAAKSDDGACVTYVGETVPDISSRWSTTESNTAICN